MSEPVSTIGPTAEVRAAMGTLPLIVLWMLGFTGTTPFYPTIAAGAGAMLLLAGWVRRAPTDGAPTFPPLHTRMAHVRLAVVVAVVHYLVGAALFLLASRFVPVFAETASTAYDRAGTIPLWGAVVLGGLVSAPLEEVFWRGAVQPVITRAVARRSELSRQQPLVAVIVAAIAYGLFHAATLQLALVAAALLGGLVWGWLLHRTRSLGAAMIAHGLWTTLMLLFPPG